MATSFYEARVAPGGTARLGQASGGAFGTQLGEAVQGLGETLVQIDRNEKNAEAALKAEQIKNEIEQYRDADQNGQADTSTADGLGHTVRVKQYGLKRMAEVLDGIDNDNDRRRLETHLTAFVNDQERRAAGYEVARRAQVGMENMRGTIDQKTNRLARDGDMDMVNLELTGIKEHIYARTDVTPEQKDKLWKYAHTTIRGGFLNGLIRRDPATAQTLIGSGAFDDLDPDALEAAQRDVAAETHARAAEIAAKAKLEKADAVEQVKMFLQAGRDGVPQSREEIGRIKGLIQQFQLTGDVYDVEKIETLNTVRTVTRSMLPDQITAELNAAEARIAKAGDKASPRDIWTRDELRTIRDQRSSAMSNNPYGWAAQNGRAVAPLDLDNPASIQERRRLRGWLANVTGNADTPWLQPDELTEYARLAKGLPAQRRDLVDRLSRLGARDAYQALRQIAPQDVALQGAAALRPASRPYIFDGEERLSANSTLVQKTEYDEAFNSEVASSLRGLAPVMASATLENAKKIYASLAAQSGDTEFDKGRFWLSMHMALGGDRSGGVQRGGVGEWNNRRMLLPSSMTQDEFDRRLSRAPITGPVWADGRAMTASEFRQNFAPVAIGDGVYRFEGRGGVVRVKGGKVFTLDIRKVGR